MQKELWQKVHRDADRVDLHAARIVGYGGCSPIAYYDAARKLPNYDHRKYERAVEELTSYGQRIVPVPRLVFTRQARKIVRPILGPPPEDPEYRVWWRRRHVSVLAMREDGQEVLWADEPPAPLQTKKEPEKPKKKPTGKAPPKEPAKKRAKNRANAPARMLGHFSGFGEGFQEERIRRPVAEIWQSCRQRNIENKLEIV